MVGLGGLDLFFARWGDARYEHMMQNHEAGGMWNGHLTGELTPEKGRAFIISLSLLFKTPTN